MDPLSIFALIVLIVLLLVGLGVVIALGIMPGKIAKNRNHPQTEAIQICGWFGVLSMGILMPLAYIWACTNTGSK